MKQWVLATSILLSPLLAAQEANFGFEVPVTASFFTAQTRRPGSNLSPAFRGVITPSVKLGRHWFGYAALQVHSSPYFYEQLQAGNSTLHFNVLQAYIGYTRASGNKSLVLKAGQLTSAFGSFPLRYDDARNWLIDLPQSYGYYYFPVSVYGLPGVEADLAWGNADFRVQLTNSSPSNPRRLWQDGQYGTFTAGGGYRFGAGLRVGVSAMRGPYLHRQHRFFFPGEADPKKLPATGYGVDLQWGKGRWTVNGEAQRFQYPYRAIPYYFTSLAYGEVKFTINPRWYVASRVGTRWRTAGMGRDQAYEMVVAYRPAKGHLLKAGYLDVLGPNVFGVQYIVSLRPPAVTFD